MERIKFEHAWEMVKFLEENRGVALYPNGNYVGEDRICVVWREHSYGPIYLDGLGEIKDIKFSRLTNTDLYYET